MEKLIENYFKYLVKGSTLLTGLKLKWFFIYPSIWLLYSFVCFDFNALFDDFYNAMKMPDNRFLFIVSYVWGNGLFYFLIYIKKINHGN